MRFTKATIAFYFALVFLSGAVVGVFGQRLYHATTVISGPRPTPEEFRKRALAEYKRRLNLSDEQLSKVNAMMDETQARVAEVRKQMHPAYQKIHEDQMQKMKEILTPEQQNEYDKMLKEREQHERQNGSRGPGGI